MHSIGSLSSKSIAPALSHKNSYVNETDLKNINFENIVKLNVSGAFPKKKNSAYSHIPQIDNFTPLLKKKINVPIKYDLLEDAFAQFHECSLVYRDQGLDNDYMLRERIEAIIAKYYQSESKAPQGISSTKMLGVKRETQFDILRELVDNNQSPKEAKNEEEPLSKHSSRKNSNKEEEIANNGTQNSSNNEPSSISIKCLHKIKKKLLRLGNKYQTIYHPNKKELLFSIGNYLYAITVTRDLHKISFLNKTELHKRDYKYSSDIDILMELQKVLKGLKYLIDKRKAIE